MNITNSSFDALPDASLYPADLARAASVFGVARAVVERQVADALVQSVTLHPAGLAVLHLPAFQLLPYAVAWRVVARVITTVSGAQTPPRYAQIRPLVQALQRGSISRSTCGGLVFEMSRAAGRGEVYVCREPSAWEAPLCVMPGTTRWWDGRFRITNQTTQPVEIAACNVACTTLFPPLPTRRRAQVRVPSVWVAGRCVRVPCQHHEAGSVSIDFLPAKPLADPVFVAIEPPGRVPHMRNDLLGMS